VSRVATLIGLLLVGGCSKSPLRVTLVFPGQALQSATSVVEVEKFKRGDYS